MFGIPKSGVSGHTHRRIGVFGLAISIAASAASAQMVAPGEPVAIPGIEIAGWGKVDQVAGRFGLPAQASGKVPAVLILHGSNSIDGRGAFYATALQEAGIATLEITMFARGAPPGPSVNLTLPHAAAALRWLAAQPAIDGERLGAIGFSWGGQMAVMLSSRQVQERLGANVPKTAALVSLYPVCTNMGRYLRWDQHPLYRAHETMGAAPLLIMVGTRDDTESEPRACDAFIALLPPTGQQRTTARYLEGATHGFDQGSSFQYYDAMARARKGATVNVVASEKDAAEARNAAVAFFRQHLVR